VRPATATRGLRIMTFWEFVILLLLAGGAWLLWDGLKAREAANAAIRAACNAQRHLFLDDTVALESMWPQRGAEGRVMLRRVYGFEYSDTGHNRRKGRVSMLADRVAKVDIEPAPDAAVDAPPP
jgi:hypothetical protein